MKILIINGPNLNLLGVREPDIYGNQSFDSYLETLKKKYPDVEISYFQSNGEGALVDCIHEFGFSVDGIIINAAAYTHTSVAIADALSAITATVVEVHISNVFKREDFRHHSFISPVVQGVIGGFGLKSYELALNAIVKQ
ncbi:type II 3-dehydroquinate dehydratase [Geofilum rubicundum]|uniref:3-dehydroquinate dehydratase n=1 Tax=Geofilum rubicundum JCM 15548 TaxID=1236989 RepID=A0A0E9M228_9BACT|nr:type II 3-dehydroquinate dehydratase [Geofilum rubicundum]GAO31426.1 3-dehydroquinate dehydratase II [Geofilum rubicundum JCM 15548]